MNSLFSGKKEYMVYDNDSYKCMIKGVDQNNFIQLKENEMND